MEEIVNKVAASKLEVFDLEDYYPDGKRLGLDIAQWLEDGFFLREKDFRESLKNHDWTCYDGCYVAIFCSTDAIIPAWAVMLVAIQLEPHAIKSVAGTISDLDLSLYGEILPSLDYSAFTDKPVIIKGCSRKPVPQGAYVMAAQHLKPFAKSIMYGEACSAVPLFRKK